uniref:Putative secreted peptide n=1 Tax=Anopheles braziliensis TaxID=58242 RepID=A0A2M3ZWH8_9DIPT
MFCVLATFAPAVPCGGGDPARSCLPSLRLRSQPRSLPSLSILHFPTLFCAPLPVICRSHSCPALPSFSAAS